MPETVVRRHGTRVLVCEPDGPPLRTDRDAVEIVGQAWDHGVGTVVIPVARLGADFFRLRTRVAGEIVQKFVTYKIRLVIVGAPPPDAMESDAWRAFVAESNRGGQVWFVPTLEDLDARLERAQEVEPPGTGDGAGEP